MVLLVEDDAGLRGMLHRSLERAGYTVIAAAHGREALEQARVRTIDLVVTDILMPEMDGFELIRRLRAEWPELPIIAMSGIHDAPNFRNLAFKYGAKAALSKPVGRAQLIEIVRRIAANESESPAA